MQLSPVLSAQGTYPFVRIERAKREAAARGIDIIDFGQGDPREPTDSLIRQALVDALEERMGYPKAEGLPELREAIAAWCLRRFGVVVEADPHLRVPAAHHGDQRGRERRQLAADDLGGRLSVASARRHAQRGISRSGERDRF